MIETAVITNAEGVGVFTNPRQRRILLTLIDHERSMSDLSGLTGMPLNLLHYYIAKFLRLGLIEISRCEQRAGAAMKFYRASATRFFVPAEFFPVNSPDAMTKRLRAALDQGLADSVKGIEYSHGKGGPRIRRVNNKTPRATSMELWIELRLTDLGAAALADEIKHIVSRHQSTSETCGRNYILHAAIAAP